MSHVREPEERGREEKREMVPRPRKHSLLPPGSLQSQSVFSLGHPEEACQGRKQNSAPCGDKYPPSPSPQGMAGWGRTTPQAALVKGLVKASIPGSAPQGHSSGLEGRSLVASLCLCWCYLSPPSAGTAQAKSHSQLRAEDATHLGGMFTVTLQLVHPQLHTEFPLAGTDGLGACAVAAEGRGDRQRLHPGVSPKSSFTWAQRERKGTSVSQQPGQVGGSHSPNRALHQPAHWPLARRCSQWKVCGSGRAAHGARAARCQA